MVFRWTSCYDFIKQKKSGNVSMHNNTILLYISSKLGIFIISSHSSIITILVAHRIIGTKKESGA